MTKKEFQAYCRDKIIYLDGATGSNLMKSGMPVGVCPEKWVLDNREVMIELQRDYILAGTDILYAPTFSANRIKLKEYGLASQMKEMIQGLVGVSRQAIGEAKACGNQRQILIAGDLTMTGEQLVPVGKLEFEELVDIYKEQVVCLEEAGVDLLVVETMMSLQEARAALIAAKEVSNLAVMVTMTFEADGRTLFGTDAGTAGLVLESLGAAAVGANCSTGPGAMKSVIEDILSVTRIPVIAKPNAGLPAADSEGNTYYDMGADQFAEEMSLLAACGASVLGGCCGTRPEYIRKLRAATSGISAGGGRRRQDGIRYLASERQTLGFSLDERFLMIGERINPTGKKLLQAQLREGNYEMVGRFAEEQEASGALILDVNMGMSGIDEKEAMCQALMEVAGVSNLPLSLDTSHVDVMKEALRRYPGRALMNSISLEKEKFEKLLPLAADYGAMFILLPLSDKGLPENLEEKKAIIHTIMDRALELGMRKEDIVVDGLVTTVGANPQAALETLETIRYCKELGLATVCGLSNISFGMPERSFVNTAFLALAIQAGLTMAIANPSQEILSGCAFATDLLLNREGADSRYIEHSERWKSLRQEKELKEARAAQKTIASTKVEPCKQGAAVQKPDTAERARLFEGIMKGRKAQIVDLTREALASGEDAQDLLQQVLLPAINLVGDYFDKGKYFLPQLIGSAEAMKRSIEILEPLLLRETTGDNMPVVVIATVEGDIHDIGKNLVALMLKNYGFRVIDLGKDVPKEKIIEAAKEYKAQIIGLSALMTTTMQRMRDVVQHARENGVTAKIMIGGAVITQDYADEIGADGYSADAAEAIKLARRLIGMLQKA